MLQEMGLLAAGSSPDLLCLVLIEHRFACAYTLKRLRGRGIAWGF